MLWDRVESEGPSGTSHGLSLLLRRHVAGSDGPRWEALGLAHNPEGEGSKPSPATIPELGLRLPPPPLARTSGLVVNGFVNRGVRDRWRGPHSVAPQDELRYRLGAGAVAA